jgi:hypothetical protein
MQIRRVGAWFVSFLTFGIVFASHAGEPVKLSSDVATVRSALRAKPADGRVTLLVDRATLDPDETEALLGAIDDARAAGTTVVAVCPRAGNGVSDSAGIVALSCDAIVFVKGAEIAGACEGWCGSTNQADRIAAQFVSLARIDPTLGARFLDCAKALSWSPQTGFKPDSSGAAKLALAGKPLRLGASQLKRVQVATEEFDTLDAALSAVASGNVKARDQAAASGTASGPSIPGGSVPGGSVPGGSKPGGTKPSVGSPSGTAPKAPAGTTVDPAIAEKLAPKLREYAKTLSELQALLREFDDYFYGRRGTWKLSPLGLRTVWLDGSDHTDHVETQITCERLQRDMKTKMTLLSSAAKSIGKIAKDDANPDVVRTKSHQAAFDDLRIAFSRNKVTHYETASKLVIQMK